MVPMHQAEKKQLPAGTRECKAKVAPTFGTLSVIVQRAVCFFKKKNANDFYPFFYFSVF